MCLQANAGPHCSIRSYQSFLKGELLRTVREGELVLAKSTCWNSCCAVPFGSAAP